MGRAGPQALPCSLAGCTLCACSAQVPHLHRSDKSLGPCTPLSTCSTFTWARLGLPHDHSPGRLPLQHTHCHWMTSLLADIGPIQLIQSFMQAPVRPMRQAVCSPFADQFNTTRPERVPALAARRQASAGTPGVLGPGLASEEGDAKVQTCTIHVPTRKLRIAASELLSWCWQQIFVSQNESFPPTLDPIKLSTASSLPGLTSGLALPSCKFKCRQRLLKWRRTCTKHDRQNKTT